MANRPVALRQSDLARYARALREAGLTEWRIEVDPVTGRHTIIAGRPDDQAGPNPCDRLLR